MMNYAKSEDTKNRLLDTMARLLRVQGYNATGINQVLEESGVPRGSLYHHFPGGKTELAAAAVNHAQQQMMKTIQQLIAVTSHPADAVSKYCEYYIQSLPESGYSLGCPIATITLETAAVVDSIQKESQRAFDSMTDLFAQELHRHGLAMEAAGKLSVMTVSAIEGALILTRARRDVRPLEIVRDNLVAQIETALPREEI